MLRWIRKLFRVTILAGIGAAVAYLLDPDRGRARRAQAKDQASAAVRRARAQSRRKARFAQGQAEGAAARAQGAGQPHPVDDVEVQRVVQQVLAGLDAPTNDVTVEVVGGVVTLRGEVTSEDDKGTIEREVGKAAGVREVHSWLHLPGTPAPNKASALQAS
jgi:osmotically-inducible protein OsmY